MKLSGYTTVPFVNLSLQHQTIKERLLRAVENTLLHGNSILGPEVLEFEHRFAAHCGVKYAVGVNNGTNALILTLRALNIGRGDEVITAVNSFLASASSIALSCANPILVDVRDDYTIDPNKVEHSITSKTKAIIAVHLTGRPSDMTSLCEIATRHNIHLIEDAAQAAGAIYKGKPIGSMGIAGCFSLHPLKILSAIGDGGIITTDNEKLYKYLLKARNHGLRNRDECEFWSYNCRLDTVQAAMLLVKMDYIEEWINKRRSIASFYRKQFADCVEVPHESPEERAVYQNFVIQCEKRDELQKYLLSRCIETKVHYPIPIHLQEAASTLGYKIGDFPVAERQSKRILSVPIYAELTQKQQEHVVRGIRSFYGK